MFVFQSPISAIPDNCPKLLNKNGIQAHKISQRKGHDKL